MILPKDFDWKMYFKLNPFLGAAGLTKEYQARYHYYHYGSKKGLRYLKGTYVEDFLDKNEYYNSLPEKEKEDLKNSIESFKKNLETKENLNASYKLDVTKLVPSFIDLELLKKQSVGDSNIESGYKTACVIAFKGRHKMVELNVITLSNQSLIPAIILVCSDVEDSNFANNLKKTYKNVFVVHEVNYPIGSKWQKGVDFAKKLNVNGLMILGSDDLLSLDYFKNCYSKIDEGLGSSGNGVDLIGNRNWYIYDFDGNMYYLSYTNEVKIFLGGGKMFSKNFLDKVNWVIFKKNYPRHLDDFGYELVRDMEFKIDQVDTNDFIMSIKGEWEVMNKAENLINAPKKITTKMVNELKTTLFNKLKIKNINDYLK
jgi:hypothetical protein